MKLTKDFYAQNAVEAAKGLVGKVLAHNSSDGLVSGVITETEAYMGPWDRAAHSWKHRGREGRTSVLYKNGGLAYIYLIYGMYHCFNVSVNGPGVPECVLVRAVLPLEGMELIRRRRPDARPESLCDGPGKLCLAFGIDMRHYGEDLMGDTLYIEDTFSERFSIEAAKRVNLGDVGEAADYPYRFIMKRGGQ